MKTVRFWEYHNGDFVKLSLKDGQSLEHYSGGSTDEGWSSEYCKWSRDGDRLYRKTVTDGRDCDGRLTHSYSDVAKVGDLVPCYSQEHLSRPNWGQDEPTSIYDEYAVAAGY